MPQWAYEITSAVIGGRASWLGQPQILEEVVVEIVDKSQSLAPGRNSVTASRLFHCGQIPKARTSYVFPNSFTASSY